MSELDQFQIIQDILQEAISAAEDGWRELMINYHVEGGRSSYVNTCLIASGGEECEKSLPNIDPLDSLMRQLQVHLSKSSKQLFTHCVLHLTSDGKYEATYGYEPVDWDALLIPSWNFKEKS